MDYIVFSGIKGNSTTEVRISYDIACQWCKKLKQRMATFPESIAIDPKTEISVGIPKFHLHGHGPSCQSTFSFNFLPGSGRTHGEGVETEWSVMNIVATSTKEMAPSARHETLNDHWGHWNYQKVVGLST